MYYKRRHKGPVLRCGIKQSHKPIIIMTNSSPWSSLQFIDKSNVATFLLLMAIPYFCYLFKKLILIINEKAGKPNNKTPLPPGPKPWPIVGSLPEMLQNKPTFRWIHKVMNEMNIEIACIRLGNVHVIPVTCPKISREFLRKQDSNFSSRPVTMATEFTTRGHLTTALTPLGEQWKKMKKVLAREVLSPARNRWFHDKRVEEADHLVRYVYNQCIKGGLVNVRVTAQQYCGNVIRKMLFNKRYFGKGMEDGGPGLEELEHVSAFFETLAHLYAFCLSDYIPCLRGRLDLDGHEKIIKKAISTIDKYHDPLIKERIQQWTEMDYDSKMEVKDLLDVLISLKDANGNPLLSPDEISAQITEIIIATVDNPSNALEWALAEMINKPEMLQKAIEELDKVVGKERLVQESDFPRLNYVKACAREAFRLHPVTPFNPPHVALSDAIVAGYFIPKGSHVILSRQGLGRNPKVWDEPMKFKPERHMSKNMNGDHDNDHEVSLMEPDLRFISFSTGRRGCMGQTLGSSMTVMLFARLLHAFTWSAPLPRNELSPSSSSIDLSESHDSLALATPLVAVAKPRLSPIVYL